MEENSQGYATDSPIVEPDIIAQQPKIAMPVTETPTEVPISEPSTPEVLSEPESEPKPAGTLFGAIAYQNVEDIPRFIEMMKVQDAAFILVSAATYGHKKGVYTLLESEVVSKAIRVFTTPPPSSIPLEQEKNT